MPTLLIPLVAPMQSWGTTSRFDERDTQLEPSKSGVLGLLCAALGRDRAEPLDDLAALRLGVRVDCEGEVMRDYQTTTGVLTAAGKVDKERTVVSPRYFLSDAAFWVGLEGETTTLLEQLHTALRRPYWPLALGRKAFAPSKPLWVCDGLSPLPLRAALLAAPLLGTRKPPVSFRLVLEHSSEGAVRYDQPLAPFAERRFGPRFIEVTDVPLPAHA